MNRFVQRKDSEYRRERSDQIRRYRRGYLIVAWITLFAIVIGAPGCKYLPARRGTVESMPTPQPSFRTPANVLVSQHYPQLKPRRVVIVTPMSRAALLPEQHNFAAELLNALRQAGFSEAVLAEPCECDTEAIRKGRFDLQQLVDLSGDYSADAVMYCDVVSFSAYAPLQVSVSITMVDARESIAIMAIDGNWDLRDAETQSAYLNHLAQNPTDTEFQSGIKYQSPSEFLHYVSKDLAEFMQQQ